MPILKPRLVQTRKEVTVNLFILFISSFITQIIYNNSMIKVLGIKNNSHRPFILKYSNSDYIYTKHD